VIVLGCCTRKILGVCFLCGYASKLNIHFKENNIKQLIDNFNSNIFFLKVLIKNMT